MFDSLELFLSTGTVKITQPKLTKMLHYHFIDCNVDAKQRHFDLEK